MKLCVGGKNCAIVGGNAITAAAKMIGMTPAMFTRSGMYVEPPAVIAPADHALRVLDRDPALALLDEDDGDDDRRAR